MRTAHSPFACCQPPPLARQRLTHFTWYPHTQTRLGQSHCHTPSANEMRLSIRHAKAATCRDTAARPDWTRTPPSSCIRKVVTFQDIFPTQEIRLWPACPSDLGGSRHGWGSLLEQTDDLIVLCYPFKGHLLKFERQGVKRHMNKNPNKFIAHFGFNCDSLFFLRKFWIRHCCWN